MFIFKDIILKGEFQTKPLNSKELYDYIMSGPRQVRNPTKASGPFSYRKFLKGIHKYQDSRYTFLGGDWVEGTYLQNTLPAEKYTELVSRKDNLKLVENKFRIFYEITKRSANFELIAIGVYLDKGIEQFNRYTQYERSPEVKITTEERAAYE